MIGTPHLPTVRTPYQSIVKSVKQEGVMTVGTSNPTHPWYTGYWSRSWGGGGQVDNPLTVRPATLSYMLLVTVVQSTYLGHAIL